jgi:O-antigen/teichoic acid export membrane protein
VGCLILIPPMGAQGAGVATLAAFVTLAVSLVVVGSRFDRVPYELGRVLTMLGIAVPFMALSFVRMDGLFVSLVIKMLAAGVLGIGLGRIGRLHPSSLRRLLSGRPV